MSFKTAHLWPMPNVSRPTRDRARTLRRQLTLPEVMLWQHLRRSPRGLRFRRQHPLGRYILDFYCSGRALAIEVDGFVHQLAAQACHDENRDAWLKEHGVMVLRVPAADVLRDVEAVMATILATAMAMPARA